MRTHTKETQDKLTPELALEILKEMEQKNQIKIIGGLYDLDTGKVIFYC